MTSQRARKRAADREYRVTAQQRYIQARGRCERCKEGVGGRWETHHVQRRSNSGVADHAVDNLRLLCPPCHAWIHANVKLAKEQRWIVPEWPQL